MFQKPSLFKRYVNNKCEKSPFLLQTETFISITNGYIVISSKELYLDSACENNIKQERISEPSLLLGNNCKLYNNYDLLYLRNTIRYNTFEYFNVTYDIQYLIFCVKTKIDTPTHVIIYNASVQPLLTEPPKNKRIKI